MRKPSRLISALFLTLPFLAGCHSGMQNPTALNTLTPAGPNQNRGYVPPYNATSGGGGSEIITPVTNPNINEQTGLGQGGSALPNIDFNHPPADWILVTVHFGFDQFNLTHEDQALVAAAAKAMAADPTIRVVAVGHCDHYGSDQYNLSLSDKRANTVKAFLTQNGAVATQTEILAYGKYGSAPDVKKDAPEAKNDRRVDVIKIPANMALPGGPPSAQSAGGAPSAGMAGSAL